MSNEITSEKISEEAMRVMRNAANTFVVPSELSTSKAEFVKAGARLFIKHMNETIKTAEREKSPAVDHARVREGEWIDLRKSPTGQYYTITSINLVWSMPLGRYYFASPTPGESHE